MMGDFAMSSLVDNILLMNWIELGDAFRLGLTVAKMRSNPNTRSTHECEILDGQGLRVSAPASRPEGSPVFQLSEPDLARAGAAYGPRRRVDAEWVEPTIRSSTSPCGSPPWRNTAR